MSLTNSVYISKLFQSVIVQVPVDNENNVIYKTRAPIYPEELWNEYHRIVVPPDFPNYDDGTISDSGVVQLYKNRDLTRISDNIYELLIDKNLLSRIIFNSEYADLEHTLANK